MFAFPNSWIDGKKRVRVDRIFRLVSPLSVPPNPNRVFTQTSSCLHFRSQHSPLSCCTTYLAAPTPLLPTTSSLRAFPLFLPSLMPTILLPRNRRLLDSDQVHSKAARLSHHRRTIKLLFLNITCFSRTNQIVLIGLHLMFICSFVFCWRTSLLYTKPRIVDYDLKEQYRVHPT